MPEGCEAASGQVAVQARLPSCRKAVRSAKGSQERLADQGHLPVGLGPLQLGELLVDILAVLPPPLGLPTQPLCPSVAGAALVDA